MNMIGISICSATMRFCRSRPLRSGSVMSNTRQLGAISRGQERNSCADENVCGRQPAKRIINSSDSRTETSSSTTNTIGIACEVRDNRDLRTGEFAEPIHTSQLLERSIERLEQCRVAEWFKQALHGTLLHHSLANSRIPVSGDENDRNILPGKLQFPLEIGAAQPRHGNIENQTSSLVAAIRIEKPLSRRERANREAELPKQVG